MEDGWRDGSVVAWMLSWEIPTAPLGLENKSLLYPLAPWTFPGATPSHAELSSCPAGGSPAFFPEHPPLAPATAQCGADSGWSPLHHSGLLSPCPERQETGTEARPRGGRRRHRLLTAEQDIEFGQVTSPPAPDSVCSPVQGVCDRDPQAPPAPIVSASVPAP